MSRDMPFTCRETPHPQLHQWLIVRTPVTFRGGGSNGSWGRSRDLASRLERLDGNLATGFKRLRDRRSSGLAHDLGRENLDGADVDAAPPSLVVRPSLSWSQPEVGVGRLVDQVEDGIVITPFVGVALQPAVGWRVRLRRRE